MLTKVSNQTLCTSHIPPTENNLHCEILQLTIVLVHVGVVVVVLTLFL